jgi:hypothetical protein
MWRFIDVSATNPIPHLCQNVVKLSHLDAIVCPRKRHYILPPPKLRDLYKLTEMKFSWTRWHLFTCMEKMRFIRLDNLVVTYPDNLIVSRLKNCIVNYWAGKYDGYLTEKVDGCVISDFRRDVNEIRPHLGFYAVWNGSLLPTFRINLSVPSSNIKHSKKNGLLDLWRLDL